MKRQVYILIDFIGNTADIDTENVWLQVDESAESTGGASVKFYTSHENLVGTTVTVPLGFDGDIFNRNVPENVVEFTQAGTTLTITSGATDDDFLWIFGLQPNI